MGRTKWYSEPDSNKQQQPRNTNSANKTRRAGIIRGSFVPNETESLTLSDLFRMMIQRVRRNWVAFRFQLNRFTFGTFKKQGALKLGFLVAAGYFLVFYDKEASMIPFISSGPVAVETKLDLSTGSRGISKVAAHKTIREEAAPKKSTKNEAAPMDSGDLGDDASGGYIGRFSKIAKTEMGRYGVPASISLAQGLIESRAGTSKLARNNNNHFGMKCFSKNCKAGHCSNFTDDSHKDFFRIFKNPWDCWRAHSEMISTGRYAKLRKYGRDYKKWAYGLKSVGYATDHNYAEKLIGVIERHQLYKYDR
jgi:flagellum-specific peptidoglycan hydrolase FlgJ